MNAKDVAFARHLIDQFEDRALGRHNSNDFRRTHEQLRAETSNELQQVIWDIIFARICAGVGLASKRLVDSPGASMRSCPRERPKAFPLASLAGTANSSDCIPRRQ
jgi:hypothetical protein